MNSKRLYYLLLASLAITVGGIVAVVYYGNSLLTDRAERLNVLKVEDKTLNEQQIALIQAKEDIRSYSELEKIAKTVVPQEKDQARTVREIIALANDSGVAIASIAFPSSALGEQKKAAPAVDGDGQTAVPAVPTPATPTTTQVEPVKGISGLFQMDISVQGAGRPVPYGALIEFLSRLEQNRRTAQVINLGIQPSTIDRNQLTFNLVLRVYIKP